MDRPDLHFTSEAGATVTVTAKAFATMAEFAGKRSQLIFPAPPLPLEPTRPGRLA